MNSRDAGFFNAQAELWSEQPSPEELATFEQALELEQVRSDAIAESSSSLAPYLQRIGQIPLLKPEEEVELAKDLEVGLFAAEKLRIGQGLWALSPQRESDLTRLSVRGERARKRLIESNTRLVVKIAEYYKNPGLSFEDRIQEGNLGLMHAVEKFDYTKGYKFSTYATWWIRQAITRAIAEQGRVIRVPVYLATQISALNRTKGELANQLQRDPTYEEVAAAMDIPAERVKFLETHSRQISSLDALMEDRPTQQQYLATEQPNPQAVALSVDRREALLQVARTLKERDAKLLLLRSGLFDGRIWTLEEVGQELGVRKERARQMEARVYAKLRHPSRVWMLRGHRAA